MLDFTVVDLEAAHRLLQVKGAQVGEIRSISERRRQIELCDPDGNPILLHEAAPVPSRSSRELLTV